MQSYQNNEGATSVFSGTAQVETVDNQGTLSGVGKATLEFVYLS